MKLLFLPLLLFLLALPACSDGRSALQEKMEGRWRRSGSGVYAIQQGTVSFESTGFVLAQYEVVDPETIRVQLKSPGSSGEFLVKVEFKSGERMVWRRVYGGEMRIWWTFDRAETASI